MFEYCPAVIEFTAKSIIHRAFLPANSTGGRTLPLLAYKGSGELSSGPLEFLPPESFQMLATRFALAVRR